MTGIRLLNLAAFLLPLLLALPARTETRIQLDPDQRYQTFRGWETTVELGWSPEFEPHVEEIAERLVTEIGITRLRVEVYAGDEKPENLLPGYIDGTVSYEAYAPTRYSTVNDDDDPFHINRAGFDFADLDFRMDRVVLPMLRAAEAEGQELEINLTYVAFTSQIVDGTYIHTDAEEYAEFILAAFLHLKQQYGLAPDALEVMLEPDNDTDWTPDLLGKAVAAATRRLREAGFEPRIILPSVTDAENTLPWLEGIAAVPGAMDMVREVSYHRYWGGTRKVVAAIAARAAELGLETSMLEFWFDQGTHEILLDDLTVGMNSVWQGHAALYHYWIDESGPDGSHPRLKEIPRYNVLYFRTIRPGAVRIGAESDNPGVRPVAFVNTGGANTVVMNVDQAEDITISGLPADTYSVSYATGVGTTEILTRFTVPAGGALSLRMPGKGVMAVTALEPPPQPSTASAGKVSRSQ